MGRRMKTNVKEDEREGRWMRMGVMDERGDGKKEEKKTQIRKHADCSFVCVLC